MEDEVKNEDIFLDAPVAEMTDTAAAVIQLDPDQTRDLLKRTKDDDPQFPIVRVEEGLSENKFNWTPEMLESVADQINEKQPVAYMGHIKPEDDRWVFPDPQTIWLKAKTVVESGKKVLYVKGYNLPKAKIRDLVAAGIARSTSWRGKADVKFLKGGVQEPYRFHLDSFDWSRPGKNAMSAALVGVVAEQTENERSEDEVKPEDIAKLSLSELQTSNPNLVELIKREAVAEKDTVIAEMEETKQEGEDAKTLLQRLREVLHIDEKSDILEAVGNIIAKVEKIGTDEVMARIEKVLTDKVPSESARAVVKRLIPQITVAEMSEINDDDKFKEKIEAYLDSDDNAKAVIAEMNDGPTPPSQRRTDGRQGSDYEPGRTGKSGSVRVGSVKL